MRHIVCAISYDKYLSCFFYFFILLFPLAAFCFIYIHFCECLPEFSTIVLTISSNLRLFPFSCGLYVSRVISASIFNVVIQVLYKHAKCAALWLAVCIVWSVISDQNISTNIGYMKFIVPRGWFPTTFVVSWLFLWLHDEADSLFLPTNGWNAFWHTHPTHDATSVIPWLFS